MGWAIQPWTGSADPIDIVGQELGSVKELADLDGAMWDYEKKGHQLELVGTDEFRRHRSICFKIDKERRRYFHLLY